MTGIPATQGLPGTSGVQKIVHGTPEFVRTNIALFAAGLATFALLYCVQPLLPVFSAIFQVGATEASLALSLTTALLAVSMLAAGVASEAWGRKPMMVASLLLSAVLALAGALVHHWEAFLLTRALMGLALSGMPAVAMAYVVEEMHPRSLSLAMALYVGGTGLGGMAGRLFMGAATDFWNWRAGVFAMAVLGIACTLILWRYLPASRHFVRRPLNVPSLSRTYVTHLKDRTLPKLFAEGFIVSGAFVTIYNYVGYRLAAPPFALSQTEIGLIFAAYLCGIVSAPWTGSLSLRFGRQRLLPITFGIMLLGILLTGVESLWAIVLGVSVLTVGFFSTHSIISTWVGAVTKSGRAQASSLYLFAYYLGSSIIGSLGGVFWSHGGWPGVMLMTGVLIVIAMATAWRLRRHPA